MTFEAPDLARRLAALTRDDPPRRWLVGYSGGIDSGVLLHAMTRTATLPVVAVHVNHGLHADADAWQSRCEATARAYGADFHALHVAIPERYEQGPEAAARAARYAAFESFVDDGDCLLSAHHELDQAETLLLNLMRGSGPAGLAAIRPLQAFGRGRLLRPLLGVSRADIEDYARSHDVEWIDDPSNADTRFDRNFLRREVLPLLGSRWPAAGRRLARSAELAAEASDLLDDLADLDIGRCGNPARLSVTALATLKPARQRNLLRRAVRRLGLPPPPATRLHQVQDVLLPARADAMPLVEWQGAEVRRYRDCLYLLPPLPPPATGGRLVADGPGLALGVGLGELALESGAAAGIDPATAAAGLEVRFRAGGEALRVADDGPQRSVKNLLQERGVLPWYRPYLPFLYADDELVAVGDLWLNAAARTSPGCAVRWRDRPPIEAAPDC